MKTLRLVTALMALVLSSASTAGVIFSDDFESGFGNWTTITGYGQIVADPLQADNALNFTNRKSGGDTFTTAAFASATPSMFILEFDYLGTCTTGDCGGYIGYSAGMPGAHSWLEGTGNAALASNLVDNGEWARYSVAFTSSVGPNIHIMLEDFVGPGQDAYFDNILLTDAYGIPEPGVLSLLALGLLGLGFMRRQQIKALVIKPSPATLK